MLLAAGALVGKNWGAGLLVLSLTILREEADPFWQFHEKEKPVTEENFPAS